MGSTPLNADELKSLAATFSGVLLQPGDDGYEEARKIHNGLSFATSPPRPAQS